MSGKSARTKGAAAERELFNLLNKKLGKDYFARNLQQTRQGGCDDGNADVFALEVKRQENLNFREAIKQAEKQANDTQFPVLAYRRNREEWKLLVVCDLDKFGDLFETLTGVS